LTALQLRFDKCREVAQYFQLLGRESAGISVENAQCTRAAAIRGVQRMPRKIQFLDRS
jgi:hypothetical protein